MRKAVKQVRGDKATERSHPNDGIRTPDGGDGVGKSGPRSIGHGGAGADFQGLQRADPEYMRRYYQSNKVKWDQRRRRNRDKINAAKRERYRNDPKTRAYYIGATKRYRERFPHKRRHGEIAKRYGLTVPAYEAILKSQSGRCAICRLVFPRTPHVDHCHKSRVVRGLLCFNCNRAIGHLQDSPRLARNAAEYLERTP